MFQRLLVSATLAAAAAAHAQAPAAARLLKEARTALTELRSATYVARLEGTGLLAPSTPVRTAEVRAARMYVGSPIAGRIYVKGEEQAPDGSTPGAFGMVYDGLKVRWLNPDGSLTSADPGEGQMGILERPEMRLLVADFVLAEPLKDQVESGRASHEGVADVGGVKCDLVKVEFTPPGRTEPVRVRWSLGVDDHLPRRYEIFAGGDTGEAPESALVLTLTNLKPNEKIEGSAFRLTPPAAPAVPATPVTPRLTPRQGLLSMGSVAPDWTLKDPAGKDHRLTEYRGKVVVLDFWATWCGPCKAAMPGIQALHEKYKDRPVEVFGVNAWERGDADAYMKQQGYTYGLLLKGNEVADGYGVKAIPTIYVIGPDGRVRYARTGTSEAELKKIERIIDQQLKKQGG